MLPKYHPMANVQNARPRLYRCAAMAVACLLASSAAWAVFPDSQKPPTGWTKPVFHLSQTYPATLPSSPADTAKPWLTFDFTKPAQAPQYMQAVLDYCMEGNVNLTSPQKSFADIRNNSVRGWYHAPWMHAQREFMHGMTNERGSRPKQLGPKQTKSQTNWAVGFYNPLGGYTLGQVWKDAAPDPAKAKFPEGSVSCKLLFTSTPAGQVPYLSGTFTWQGDINRQKNLLARPVVRLLQLDIAIKDNRAPGVGWVFGTFQYEKAASSSTQWWKHMVPVGLMWGNDLSHIKANQPPTEQWVNADRDPQLHVGFRGLLNGPIDNPQASCVACHGFAQIAKPSVASPSPKLPGNSTWSQTMSAGNIDIYFRKIDAATALSADYQSLDYSLQLQAGVTRFRTAHPAAAVHAAGHAAAPLIEVKR
ncbi:MAG: hypothetical protein ABJD53_07385 [Gammaproteobacteria bacterium]